MNCYDCVCGCVATPEEEGGKRFFLNLEHTPMALALTDLLSEPRSSLHTGSHCIEKNILNQPDTREERTTELCL